MKNWTEVLAEMLKLSKVPKKLQIYLIVDFINKLLLVARKDAILVVCDRLPKITHFVATMESMLAERLAWLFRDNIWKLHGFSKGVVLDRKLQFVAKLTKKLNKILGIETKLLTLFHPQINSQTERMNQKLEYYLQFFINHRQKNWPEWLVMKEFAVNNKYIQ